MSIDLYRPFTNPVTRETFRCISSTDEAYITEWVVDPGGHVPFEHVHMNQDEVFHIHQGEMRVKINGQEHIAKAGQTVIAPRGARHIAFNDKAEKLVCIVEYRPGLDHYQTMQCFAGLTIDKKVHRNGLVNVPKIMFFLKKIKAESLARPAIIPDFLFRMGMNIFFVIGTVMGWEKLYRKYTG